MNKKLVSRSNFVLRQVLNNEEQLDIIKDIIEGILGIQIKMITLNPYLNSKEKYLPKEENFGIADVRIETKDNEILNIGIQFIDGFYVQNKLLLYYAQIHTNQLEQQAGQIIAKTITINILDFNYFSNVQYHKKIKIKGKEIDKDINETIELHVIELPKLKFSKELNKEQAWIAYLAGKYNKEIIENFEKIKKLDTLLNEYWKQEKIE